MRKLILVAVLAATAAVTVPAANAQTWYASAAQVAKNIESKYTVTLARCAPLSSADQRYYGAQWWNHNGTILWTHVLCIVALDRGGACVVVAHITGSTWTDFTLGSYRYRGCTPYQIERRPTGSVTN